jgi:hypothetical protein
MRHSDRESTKLSPAREARQSVFTPRMPQLPDLIGQGQINTDMPQHGMIRRGVAAYCSATAMYMDSSSLANSLGDQSSDANVYLAF